MTEYKTVEFKTVFKTLIIDNELSNLMPPATEEEDARLERSIRDSGYNSSFPVIVWKGTDILVDGHRRYRFCQKHRVPFSVVEKEFESKSDVMLFIIDIHLYQKNLNPKSQTYLIGKMYGLDKLHQAELEDQEVEEDLKFIDSVVESKERISEMEKLNEFYRNSNTIFSNTGVNPDDLFEKMLQSIDTFISKIAKADIETQKRVVKDIMEEKVAWKMIPIKQEKRA